MPGRCCDASWLTSAAWGVAAALHSHPFEPGLGRRLISSRPALCPRLLFGLETTVQTAAGVRRPAGIKGWT